MTTQKKQYRWIGDDCPPQWKRVGTIDVGRSRSVASLAPLHYIERETSHAPQSEEKTRHEPHPRPSDARCGIDTGRLCPPSRTQTEIKDEAEKLNRSREWLEKLFPSEDRRTNFNGWDCSISIDSTQDFIECDSCPEIFDGDSDDSRRYVARNEMDGDRRRLLANDTCVPKVRDMTTIPTNGISAQVHRSAEAVNDR